MGNKISTVTAITGIDSYVSELRDIRYQKSIGNARFMKTILGRHDKDGYVVVKIFVKPELGMSLSKRVKKLKEEYKTLSTVPNAFCFQRVLETEKAAYLVRQYLYSNLYDRISTRPFLTTIEKKWIAYQLLRSIADSHSKKIYHGDIKTENVLVTSWNWAYLVDFASFKPTYLPENNPADFSFFFDTSSRRTCYIAPERFYKSGTDIDHRNKQMGEDEYLNELTPKMDVFSIGCVIAELFLEGTSLFTLSQLFRYKSGEYNPTASLNKIEDKDIRGLVAHMIQIDPESRLSAEEYLLEWRGRAFPHYFYSFLYNYMGSITDHAEKQKDSTIMSALSTACPNTASKKLTYADEKIERIFLDFEKIMYYVSYSCDDTNDEEKRKTRKDSLNAATASSILLSPESNIPNYSNTSSAHEETVYKPGEEGSLVLLAFVCSLIRNTLYPSSKLKALDILLALAERLPDDVKLDRLVPYLMCLLTDDSALVRANSIKTLTKVLCMVESILPINARIFPEYILPSLRSFTNDPDDLVRSTYASCIALLAETALRFLEMTQLFKTDNMYPVSSDTDSEDLNFESSYDSYLQEIQSVIQEQATMLLIDKSSSVKRALLTNITSLCVFFGRQKANDVLLSHMITYLNDKDWMLRSAFFESIKGVGTFVGSRSLEEYILPLMVQALTDSEEFVVEKVLNSLASLADLGLFPKMKLWEIVSIIWPLICHPNVWVRNGAISFVSSAIKHLPEIDVWCIVYPLIRPFLRSDISDVNEESLLANTEGPISRQVYEQAIIWAGKATISSNFWKKQKEPPKLDKSKAATITEKEDLLENSQEDEIFLERLRSVGMSGEDEGKLRYMRDYIYKVSRVKMRNNRPISKDTYENAGKEEVFLKNLGVTPMTVFLPDLSQQIRNAKTKLQKPSSTKARNTSSRANSREDMCNLNQVASQPHIKALVNDSNQTRISSINIQTDLDSDSAPNAIDSPSEYNFGSSLPKDLERPKSVILTMDSIKTRNNRMDESIRIDLIDQGGLSNEEDREATVAGSVGYAHLQKLLFKTAIEAFPPHIPEFIGASDVLKRFKRVPQSISNFRSIHNWKPEGILVAHFTEHTASINQIAISWDCLLFASCSDDGSVKIWDCSRLERNVTNRSRVTYNKQGGRIKCITFIEQTYSIASASDNGSIHIFRIDINDVGSGLKFGKCITVREYQLEDEYPLIMKHVTTNASNTMVGSKSILIFTTTKGRIYALDLLTMEVVWKFQNPKSHGIITAMTVDKMNTWLLVGTMSGILTLYDLRFHIPLKSWLHPSKSRISVLLLNEDQRAENKQVFIASGKNEVSVWDIVNLKCIEVYGVKSGDEKMTGVILESYKSLDTPNNRDILVNSFTSNDSVSSENSIRAIAAPPDCRFMITGGSDRKIRFWDTTRIENSAIVLGSELDEPKARYSTNTIGDMQFHFEFNRNNSQTGSSSRSNNMTSMSALNNSVAQQQYLMRNHIDAITNIVLTEYPYPMIISGDRDGVIKVLA
ncbi:hypothetical protein BY458DRAFT_584681 [Sporodiniella umbellata]|nr:hypothetical protein BY458DRAFT_584681 [Sporodiniella umbellata]